MHDKVNPSVSAEAQFEASLDQLFVQAREQLAANPALVASVTQRAQRRLQRRRLVLLGATALGLVCCLLFLLPAMSALGDAIGALSQSTLSSLLQAFVSAPYLLGVAAAGICWLVALSAEPG